MLALRFFLVCYFSPLVPLTRRLHFSFESATKQRRMWPMNQTTNESKNWKQLKLSQRAEGIWKRCRYTRGREKSVVGRYQMNKIAKIKRVMHRENPNVNVIGEREHINWHENDMHDFARRCVVAATVKHAPTYDRQNTKKKNIYSENDSDKRMKYARWCELVSVYTTTKQSA